jgi:hypothetical protein
LATADGVIFQTFGELVCSTAAFRVKRQVGEYLKIIHCIVRLDVGNPVLTLLMPTDLPAFAASHLKQHNWKQTTPIPCDSTEALEKCVPQFHMIDPKQSSAWGVYFAQRIAADKHTESGLKQYEGEDRPVIYEKIEDAVDDVLSCTDLGDAEPSVHDCIVPLSVELGDDGWGNVSSLLHPNFPT